MTFYIPDTFEEVLEYIKDDFRLSANSCMVNDSEKASSVEMVVNEGNTTYILYETTVPDLRGYVKLVAAYDGVREDSVAVVDFLFPGNGCEGIASHENMYSRLGELAEFLREECEFDRVYLNAERQGIRGWLEKNADTLEERTVRLMFPSETHSSLQHFEDGNGRFNVVVDLLKYEER